MVGGLAGAVAMIPPAMLLTAGGYQVNRYGRLLVEWLLGTDHRGALLSAHLLIGLISALPLAFAGSRAGRGSGLRKALLVGAAYGAVYWLMVNTLALPVLFGRVVPWFEGAGALWPSLVLHLVFGTVAALVVRHRLNSHDR